MKMKLIVIFAVFGLISMPVYAKDAAWTADPAHEADLNNKPLFGNAGAETGEGAFFMLVVQTVNQDIGQVLRDSAIAYQAKCAKLATIGWAKTYLKSDYAKEAESILKQVRVAKQKCEEGKFQSKECYETGQGKYVNLITNVSCDTVTVANAGKNAP